MNNEFPKYSVIIPVYNRERFISECIDSVLNQSFRNFEIIVCDDGSTDRTMGILASYGTKIKIVQSNRTGPGGARNAAVRQATGKYLSFLDSDDVWAPHMLESVDSVLLSTEAQMVWITGRASKYPTAWDGKKKDLMVKIGRNIFDLDGELAGAGTWGALRRSLFINRGGFTENMHRGEDWDLLFRLWEASPVAHIKGEPLVWIRVHAEQSNNTPVSLVRRCGSHILRSFEDGTYFGKGAPREFELRVLRFAEGMLRHLTGARFLERFAYIRCQNYLLSRNGIGILDYAKAILRSLIL